MNKSLLISAVAAALALASCGGKTENPEARALINNANAAFQARDYATATALLDSLQKLYPAELNIQRESIVLRPQIIEAMATAKIAEVDSMTKADELTLEQLKPALKFVKAPEMIEGYWVDAKAYNPSFMNTTGIEARVSEIGQFYIVSSASPAIKHTSIAINGGGVSVSTPEVPYDGDSNYRFGGGEIISFTPEQSDTIGFTAMNLLAEAPATPLSIVLNGAKGPKTIKLSAAQANGIVNAYRYSQAVIRARDNVVERQRLEKTIEIARRQAAKSATASPAK